ncbi:unnamed protein product [Callosobruchus maculatus]|uniref:Uncharacterized protein n=1 Tax=Callosobruchus maculatus TaxID=64391 RepID=A0A653C912_CALMS|nr:unnamed protein product [Callosobruchus maculatus]
MLRFSEIEKGGFQ